MKNVDLSRNQNEQLINHNSENKKKIQNLCVVQVVKNKNFNEKNDQSPFDIKYLNNENVSKPGS